MKALTPREASIFACLADTVVAPEPRAAAGARDRRRGFFDRWLARAPRAEPDRAAGAALRARARAAARWASARGCARSPRPSARAAASSASSSTARPQVRQLAKLLQGHRVPRLLRRRRRDARARLRRRRERRARAASCGRGRAGRERARRRPATPTRDGTRHVRAARASASSDGARDRAASARCACDVCVIGTGAGGAPVAKELAEGGMSVVMLEEGERFTDRRLHRAPARDDRRCSTATPARSRRSATRRSCCRSGRAVGGTTTDQLGHLLPHARRRCSRCGASASGSTS